MHTASKQALSKQLICTQCEYVALHDDAIRCKLITYMYKNVQVKWTVILCMHAGPRGKLNQIIIANYYRGFGLLAYIAVVLQ